MKSESNPYHNITSYSLEVDRSLSLHLKFHALDSKMVKQASFIERPGKTDANVYFFCMQVKL